MSRFQPQRLTQTLDGPWRIAPAAEGRGEAEGWANGIPGEAVVKAGEITDPDRCWYEKSMSINAALLGCKHLWLRIKLNTPSPGMECTVWIDGHRLAKQPVRLAPLSFPLDGTSALDPSIDISHRFVLLITGSLPEADFKIWIEGCNNQVIHNFKIEPDPENNSVRTTLSLDQGFGRGPHQLTYSIFNAKSTGKKKAITSGSLATTGWATIPFEKFKPWTLEKPQCYLLEIVIENALGQRDKASLEFGMRGISLEGESLRLNKKTLPLSAVALSQRGDRKEIQRRLLAVKESGFNAVWLGSGLNHEAWAAAADEIGVMLIVSPPPPLPATSDTEENKREAMLASVGEMIAACGNSPAIICWSAAMDNSEFSLTLTEEAMREIRHLDPSRTVISGIEPGQGCSHGWLLPAHSEALLKGGGLPYFSVRPGDRAGLRELARFRPGVSPAWMVLKPVASKGNPYPENPATGSDWIERCRAGFDALEMPRSIGDFEDFRDADRKLRQKTLAEILSALHCNPYLAGIVIDGRNWGQQEELEFLDKLMLANNESMPIFFAPPLTLHEGEDEDFYIALPKMKLKKNASLSVSMIPKKHTVSVWRGEIKANLGGNKFARITIPGKFLLPGRYQLVLEADWEEGGISDISVEVLPGNNWNNTNLKLLTIEPSVAKGLGFSNPKSDGTQTALLSLENSVLAYDTKVLAEALAKAEAGGTLFFLGTPKDTGEVLHKIGVLRRPFKIHSIGERLLSPASPGRPPAPLYFGRTSSLFEDLPSNGMMDAHWAESFPNHLIETSFGRLHAGIFCEECDPPWGATILEVPLGKGRLILTTFRWLGALGRDPITEALLGQLLECFRPNSSLGKIPKPRITELTSKLNSIKNESRLWHVIGPFRVDSKSWPPPHENQWDNTRNHALAEPFPPENQLDLSSNYTGIEGRILRWRKCYTALTRPDAINPGLMPSKVAGKGSHRNQPPAEPVIISTLFVPKPEAVSYAITTIKSESKKSIPALLTTPHPTRIFVNSVMQAEYPGGCNKIVTLSLKRGDNIVCVKTVGVNVQSSTQQQACPINSPWQWGFAMELVD